MRNLTDYNDQFILHLIEQNNGNPCKCTANVQYAVEGNSLIPVLIIYQDNSVSWEIDDVVLFCEKTEAVDYCDERMSLSDFFAMLSYYKNQAFQDAVNDIEYEEASLEEARQYDEWMTEELAWYNHARMMGWE